MCVSAYELQVTPAEQPCSSARDCLLSWQVCDATTASTATVCQPPQQACSKNCSNHGECIYVNSVMGGSQSECRLDDVSCEAVCTCRDQHFGTFCELGTEELKSRRELRSNLIDSLYNLTSTEDVNAESISAWSASLYSLSIKSHELSTRDISTVAAIANITLQSALALEIDSYEDIVGLLQATDTVASLLKYNNNPNDYRTQDFNSTRKFVNNTAAAVVHTVSAFGDLVARSMVLGQNATTLLYDNFRLSVQIEYASASAVGITAQGPQSTFEQLTGADASSVRMAPSSAQAGTVAVKLIAVNPRSYAPDTSAFVSSPLMLQVQTQGDPEGSPVSPDEYLSNVEFTFQHNEPQYQFLHSEVVNLTTVCSKRDESEQHSFVCPESGNVLTHNCSQGAGVHTSYCPKPAPGCAKLGVDSADITAFDGCKVVSYNLTYTVCSCPVAAQRRQRRYLATTEEQQMFDDSGAVNLMVSTVFIANDFADTFSAADDFNSAEDARRVLVVIVMLSVLWVPALLFLGYGSLPASVRVEPIKSKGPAVNAEAQRSVAAYIESTIPGVFNTEKSGWARLWGELLAHHDLFRFLGQESSEQRQLLVGKTVTMMTFMFFLTAAFFDVSNPGDDGSCEGHAAEASCLERTCPFDVSRTYCQWNDDSSDGAAPCTYMSQSMSITALVYLTVLTTILTAIATIPLDYLFSILSAPTAKSLTGSKVMSVIQAAVNGARRLTQRRTTVKPSGAARTTSSANLAITTPGQKRSVKSRVSSLFSRSAPALQNDLLIVSREVPEELVQASTAARASIAVIERNSMVIKRRCSSVAVPRSAQLEEPSQQLQPQQSGADVATNERDSSLYTRAVERVSILGSIRLPAPLPAKVLSTLPLCCEVIDQRAQMRDWADDTLTYDAQWGVLTTTSDQGRPVYRLSHEALIAVNADVLAARQESRKLCEVLPNYNEHHAGLEILHLFMVDLLGRNTPAAKIFQEKFGEDFGSSQIATMTQKYAAAFLLLGMNAFFAYYILLKAFQKGNEWQIQFMVCIIVQIAVDMMVFQTLECLWLNFSLPQLVNQEVAAAARKLKAHVDSLAATSELQALEEGASEQTYVVNAPAHLFVSAHVARKYPELMESMIVSSYTSPLPGEICRTWPHFKALSEQEGQLITDQRRVTWDPCTWVYLVPALVSSIAFSQQLFITIPYLYQRVIIRFVQPILFSGVCLVWYIAVQTILSAIVVGALSGACVMYILWRRYKARKAVQTTQNSVLPTEPAHKSSDTPAQVTNLERNPSDVPAEQVTSKCINGGPLVTDADTSRLPETPFEDVKFDTSKATWTVAPCVDDHHSVSSRDSVVSFESVHSGAEQPVAGGEDDTAACAGTVATSADEPVDAPCESRLSAVHTGELTVIAPQVDSAIGKDGAAQSNTSYHLLNAPYEAAVSDAAAEHVNGVADTAAGPYCADTDATGAQEMGADEPGKSAAMVEQPANSVVIEEESSGALHESSTEAAEASVATAADGVEPTAAAADPVIGTGSSADTDTAPCESAPSNMPSFGAVQGLGEQSLTMPSTSSRMSTVRAYVPKPLKVVNISNRATSQTESASSKRVPSAQQSAARDKKLQQLMSTYSTG